MEKINRLPECSPDTLFVGLRHILANSVLLMWSWFKTTFIPFLRTLSVVCGILGLVATVAIGLSQIRFEFIFAGYCAVALFTLTCMVICGLPKRDCDTFEATATIFSSLYAVIWMMWLVSPESQLAMNTPLSEPAKLLGQLSLLEIFFNIPAPVIGLLVIGKGTVLFAKELFCAPVAFVQYLCSVGQAVKAGKIVKSE